MTFTIFLLHLNHWYNDIIRELQASKQKLLVTKHLDLTLSILLKLFDLNFLSIKTLMDGSSFYFLIVIHIAHVLLWALWFARRSTLFILKFAMPFSLSFPYLAHFFRLIEFLDQSFLSFLFDLIRLFPRKILLGRGQVIVNTSNSIVGSPIILTSGLHRQCH
jgi:hypothetical protein